MTGKTHKVGGMVGCLAGFAVLQGKGLLLDEVNPLLQLMVMYPFAIYGSILPDMDQVEDSLPSDDLVSKCVYGLLHITTPLRKWFEKGGKVRKWFLKRLGWLLGVLDARHRSWQTHSDLSLAVFVLLCMALVEVSSGYDKVILMLAVVGLICGVVSHLFLDCFTRAGIWSVALSPLNLLRGRKELLRVRFVPNKPWFSADYNGAWEKLVRRMLRVIGVVLVVWIVYLMSPYRVVFM